MDKFLTYTGQQPIYLGDFNFFDKAVRNTFANLTKFIVGDEKVVFLNDPGLNMTSSGENQYQITWNDTLILLYGEVLPMPAGHIIFSTESDGLQRQLYLAVSKSYDESGTRKMRTGDTVECYEIRKATFVYATEPQDEYYGCSISELVTIDKILSDYIKTVSPGEETVIALPTYSDDTIKASIKIIKNVGSYYIAGEFVTKEPESGTLLNCTGVSINKKDLDKLVPNGSSNISTYLSILAVDASLKYVTYPARLDLFNQNDKLTLTIHLNPDVKLPSFSRGSFYTRICLDEV